MNGYLHDDYARSLQEFGEPRFLPRCQGWVLVRRIPNSEELDAMGCYPLFCCREWSELAADLSALDLVSVSMVPDPFGDYTFKYLQQSFPDVAYPFKEHFVVAPNKEHAAGISKHHRYYSRRALQELRVEVCETPIEFLDEWMMLYSELIARHQLRGIKQFSRNAFKIQLEIPGLVMFRALRDDEIAGAHLWYRNSHLATSHLAAFSETGYRLGASYALYWKAIEYFRKHGCWLNIGAGAGTFGKADDGLAKFKKGWATETRTTYFCGRILDREKYSRLLDRSHPETDVYFPAYRSGELS